MADDEFVAVVEAENQAEPQVEAATNTSVPAPETDLATKLATMQEQLVSVEKERNDLKSQTIGRQRAADRDNALHDEIKALTRSVSAMMKHLASSDLDTQPLEDALGALQEGSQKAEANQKWDAIYSHASMMLSEAVMEGSNQILDPTGPELKEARDTWNTARDDEDEQGLLLAANQAMKARIKKERELLSNPAASDSKTSLEMSVSRTSGSGPRSLNDDEIWKAYGRGEVDFTDDVKKAGESLGYL